MNCKDIYRKLHAVAGQWTVASHVLLTNKSCQCLTTLQAFSCIAKCINLGQTGGSNQDFWWILRYNAERNSFFKGRFFVIGNMLWYVGGHLIRQVFGCIHQIFGTNSDFSINKKWGKLKVIVLRDETRIGHRPSQIKCQSIIRKKKLKIISIPDRQYSCATDVAIQ